MELSGLSDPFEVAFTKACNTKSHTVLPVPSTVKGSNYVAVVNEKLLTTEKQWRAFVALLKEGGLLSEPDAMDDIWAELVTEGKMYQPEGKMRIQLSFERWREMLIKRVGSGTEGLDSSLLGIKQHARVLEDNVSSWDMESMTPEETRKLLLILAAIEKKRAIVRTGLSTACAADAYQVLLQATWSLLTEGGGKGAAQGGAAAVDSRPVGAVNNPFRWQFNHMEQIEKAARMRRPRKVRFRTTRKSGPRGEPVREDVYGLAQGLNGQYGIQVYRGTCEVKETEGREREIFVVVVPSTAPHTAACTQVNAYMAHRELALSGGVVHCLGKDWAASDEAQYLYEFAPGVTLKSLLRPDRGQRVVLKEEGLLFRYWAGQILRAMSDIQVQGCHVLHNRRLGLENVVVAGKGLKVRLGGLEWGPKISAYRDESHEELRGRMRCLMRDFSSIVLEMLGLNSHSCWHGWFSNMGGVLGQGGVEKYDHRRALEGVEVMEGDQVLIELDAQHHRMYTGYEVVIGEAAGDADGEKARRLLQPSAQATVVQVDWEDPITPIAQETQRLRVSGLQAGTCRIICRFQDLEATPDQGTEGSVAILVRVKAVEMSARLKAVLRSCQIASSSGGAGGLELQPGSTAREYLGQGKWKDRFSKFWIQDFLSSVYFAKMSDTHLDEVIAEYEALFVLQEKEEEGEERGE